MQLQIPLLIWKDPDSPERVFRFVIHGLKWSRREGVSPLYQYVVYIQFAIDNPVFVNMFNVMWDRRQQLLENLDLHGAVRDYETRSFWAKNGPKILKKFTMPFLSRLISPLSGWEGKGSSTHAEHGSRVSLLAKYCYRSYKTFPFSPPSICRTLPTAHQTKIYYCLWSCYGCCCWYTRHCFCCLHFINASDICRRRRSPIGFFAIVCISGGAAVVVVEAWARSGIFG